MNQSEQPIVNSLIPLGDGLSLHRSSINVGIIQDGERAILIDCGDGSVVEGLTKLGLTRIDAIYFTHHHRDQASGLSRVLAYAQSSPRAVVPARERAHFDDVERFWRDPAFHWHLYNFHPHNLLLARSITVQDVCREPDRFRFGDWEIHVLDTPGHTEGSVSYLVEGKGERWVFSGDAIYGPGQVWDVYSLQHGGDFGERSIRDYHGFLGARTTLAASLVKLRDVRPTALIPSHGEVMVRPAEAIDALRANLAACYESYAGISALRHYFPEMFAAFGARPDFLPIRSGHPIPPFVRHVGTTWIVISEEGSALVMDCGSRRVIEEIQRLIARGEISRVDAFWISHYHDDHVDEIPAFQTVFPVPTSADEHVAQIVTRPTAYRLPCLSPATARIDRVTTSGESWQWREFRLTSYHFPGQTYYHGALLVEGRGLRLFFIGDSFTMSGIDDYCAGNRNLLGSGQGFDASLALVDELRPDYLFNCHVDAAFSFTPEEIQFMRANLAHREERFGQLLPWDHPNYGLDEHWVRCDPYEQHVKPGQTAGLDVVITNHSASERQVMVRPSLPRGWRNAWTGSATVPSRREGKISFTILVPPHAAPGQYVIPVDLTYGGQWLGQFREGIVWVEGEDQ